MIKINSLLIFFDWSLLYTFRNTLYRIDFHWIAQENNWQNGSHTSKNSDFM